MKILVLGLLLSSAVFASENFQKLQADYVVPEEVGFPTPEEARRFQVDYLLIQNPNEPERALFTLPQDLTGERIMTDMTVTEKVVGADGVVQRKLVGSLGEANCRGPWVKMQCQYRFGLQINAQAVEKHLLQKYGADAVKFQQMKRIANTFACDPIGEIQTELKPLSLQPTAGCQM